MAVAVFNDFLKEFEQPITQFVSNAVQNVATYVDTPLRTAATLYVVLYGISILRGTIREPIMDFAWRSMRLALIVALATNPSTFQTYVAGLFLIAPERGWQCDSRLWPRYIVRRSLRQASEQGH